MTRGLWFGGMTLFAIAGWLLYFRERERSRDYATDLVSVVYTYGVPRGDLRRSLQWDEIVHRVDHRDDLVGRGDRDEQDQDHDDRTFLGVGDR